MINKLSLILSCIFSINLTFAQTPVNTQIAKVEDGLSTNAQIVFADSVNVHNIYDRMKFYGVPSVSIAVINQGKIEWAKTYGLADEKEGRKANLNTLYQAASMSKAVNGLLIMKLVQDGKLSLDKDIRQYLKTWTFPDNDFSRNRPITLGHLLSHTAGLGLHGFKGYSKGQALPSINEILDGKLPANNEALSPLFPPGTRTEYSGGGTVIMRKIIEDNVAKSYDSLIGQMVLRPIGMQHSTYSQPLGEKWKDFAKAYDQSGKEIPGGYNVYPELAPDGLWTTATDYAKFVISIQRSLQKAPSALLQYATVNRMLTPFLKGSDAALGVFVKEKGGQKYFWHIGANIGYRSAFYGSFSTGSGVVVLTNSDNGQALIDEILNGVSVVYHWKDFYKPEVRKLVAIPDTLANQYAGTYQVENPAMNIVIEKEGHGLQLTARRTEKMYFTGNNTFFLMSSPSQFGEFTASNGKTIDGLVLKNGANILFTAKKMPPQSPGTAIDTWRTLDNPEHEGWNADRLGNLKKFIIDSTPITGFMMTFKGKVVFTHGDLGENSFIASCRKSVLALLYGAYVKAGVLNLDKSLKELSVDDIGGLLPVERQATIRDLISARSGVFHPASYPGDFLEYAPQRGSVKPGTYWLYSNWDFNVAGTIFEKLTGRNIYDEVERVLAEPLHMQDWRRSLQHKEGDTTRSEYPAYPMWFSTRDMARIGQLMLNKGRWGDRQVVDEAWVNEILRPRTEFTEIDSHIPLFRNTGYHFGYGYMWWLWQQVSDDRFRDACSAFGNGGQSISVFPAVDVVVAYKTKDDYERVTSFPAMLKVLALAVQSLDPPKSAK
jgi:CubicO group peptidase (beta-lactamase class C family)